MDFVNFAKYDAEYIHQATEEDSVYTIEIAGPALRELKNKSARLDHIIEWGRKNNRSVSEYLHEQIDRHHRLLEENSMYKDAYKEFMSIRALLGEHPSLF